MEPQMNRQVPSQTAPNINQLINKILDCVEAQDEDAVDSYFGDLLDHYMYDHRLNVMKQYADRHNVSNEVAMGGNDENY